MLLHKSGKKNWLKPTQKFEKNHTAQTKVQIQLAIN
jgi:hypothetical protein